MTKIDTLYTSTVEQLAALKPDARDFEQRLDELISRLIKIKYASHLREVRADGSTDWATANQFLAQVEAGMHQHGIVSGWQDKAVTK
jgi:hypothetical protein